MRDSTPYEIARLPEGIPAPGFLNSEPVSSRDQDSLERFPDAMRLADECRLAAARGSSSVIGVVGALGVGKSSQAAMATELLLEDEDPGWLAVKFDPYLHISGDAVAANFLITVREAFDQQPRQRILKAAGRVGLSVLPGNGIHTREAWQALSQAWGQRRFRERLSSFLLRAGTFSSTIKLGPVDPGKAAQATGELLSTPSFERQKERLTAQLGYVDKNILLIIDEIDRLVPAQQALIFQLLRVASGLPRMHFLLLYDEMSVHEGLASNGTIKDASQGRKFLDKFIQFRHYVPEVGEQALERHMLNRYSNTARLRFGQSMPYYEHERFTVMHRHGFRNHLRTPRDINTFFAEIDADVAAMSQVNLADYCGVHFLRQFIPQVYEVVRTHGRKLAAIEQHMPPLWSEPTIQQDHRQKQEKRDKAYRLQWKRLIRDALFPDARGLAHMNHSEVQGAYEVCTMLFPHILGESEEYVREQDQFQARLKPTYGVSNDRYFDRYFNRRLTLAEHGEMLFSSSFWEIIIIGQPGQRSKLLSQALRMHPEATIEGMRRYLENPPPKGYRWQGPQTLSMLDLIATEYLDLMQHFDDEAFMANGIPEMTKLIEHLLNTLVEQKQAPEQAAGIFGRPNAGALIASLIGPYLPLGNGPPPESRLPVWAAACDQFLRPIYRNELFKCMHLGWDFNATPAAVIVPLLFAASKYEGPAALSAYLWNDVIQTGRVSLEDLLDKVLIVDPREGASELAARPFLLPAPESIRQEVDYKMRLLFPPGKAPTNLKLVEANAWIVEHLLGLDKALQALPEKLGWIVRRQVANMPITDRRSRLWNAIDDLKRYRRNPSDL